MGRLSKRIKRVWAMRVQELGDIGPRALIFGGPYSNRQALEAVQRVAVTEGFAPDAVICTGDAVAYCGEPVETVALLRDWGCVMLAGNCEMQLAAGAPDCGCGFEAGSACDRLSGGWFGFASARIGAADRAWMRRLPDAIVFSLSGRRVAAIHGGVSSVSRFLWSVSPEAEFMEQLACLVAVAGELDAVVAGHSGIPFIRQLGSVEWINAGAIGLPPHDGRPETRFAVLTAAGATIRSLCYDVEAAQAAMRHAGLAPDYRDALGTGWWPSEDVLPPGLRREADQASASGSASD